MNARIDLNELCRRESEQVEWKANVADPASVVETIVAFANDLSNLGGGYVVCGARETKDEHGFPAVEVEGLTAARFKEVEGKVLDLCRRMVDPQLSPLVEEVRLKDDSRRVLVFVVPASPRAHAFRHSTDSGKYYVRVSRQTIEARNGTLRELLTRKGVVEPWDRRLCSGATVDDLDLLALRDALQRMGVFDPARGVDAYLSDNSYLSPFVPPLCGREPLTGVLRPRNFAVLLFARELHRHVPGAFVLFSIYPGTDRSEPHAERHEIAGALVDQARRLMDLLNVQSYTAFDKTDASSPNVVKYPRRALHEAMVNALAHRDYEMGDPSRVTVFADRIEVLSPGPLPTGIQIDQFRAGRASAKWRNQALAWFFNRLQLAQAEGQGIPTILRVMREEGCPPPVFEASAEHVLCVLPAHPRHALIRELRDVERALSLGELGAAQEKVRALLQRDPFNFRIVQLFCEVQRALGDYGEVAAFVKQHEHDLAAFSPLALVTLADTLTIDVRAADRPLARRLLTLAAAGGFEEREARRVALSLLRVDQDSEALSFIERMVREHPDWAMNPAILQLRGRALLQLAKRCARTGRDQSLPPRTRGRAWEDCRTYLERAERDMREALTHAPEAAVRDFVNRDLGFLLRLKRSAEPPRSRRRT